MNKLYTQGRTVRCKWKPDGDHDRQFQLFLFRNGYDDYSLRSIIINIAHPYSEFNDGIAKSKRQWN